jgi:hypothetical protein
VKPSWSGLRRSDAQNTFEYLLAIGVVVVPIVLVFIAAFEIFMPEVLGWVCPSVDTADPAAASNGSCLGR